MIKQVYINGEFTKEQLERAAKKGREARHDAFARHASGASELSVRDEIEAAELAGFEAALNALTDMWSGEETPLT